MLRKQLITLGSLRGGWRASEPTGHGGWVPDPALPRPRPPSHLAWGSGTHEFRLQAPCPQKRPTNKKQEGIFP